MPDLRSYVTDGPDGLPSIVYRDDKQYISALEIEVERLRREHRDLFLTLLDNASMSDTLHARVEKAAYPDG
jgi:hypothetical protein